MVPGMMQWYVNDYEDVYVIPTPPTQRDGQERQERHDVGLAK
jgi:hypothetical protein